MKEFRFKGLDRWGNYKGGIITAVILLIIVGAGFYFLHDMKSKFLVVGFLLISLGFTFLLYQFLVAKYINKEWRIIISDSYVEFYYNREYVTKINYKMINSIQIASREGDRRYLKINYSDKKLVAEIQSYPFIDKQTYKDFDEFSSHFTKKITAFFDLNEKEDPGYIIKQFSKK